MSKPVPLPVRPTPTIDDSAIECVEAMLAEMKAGTVTAFAIVTKSDGYGRWSSCRAYTEIDRYNIIGQLHCVIKELVDLEGAI